jgi:deoxynucleoside triphosphate triphosphohydrolase SAMHD1
MHRRVYTHAKAKAMEYMVVDALEEAADYLGIKEKLNDPDDFMQLDDTLLKRLEWYEGDDPRMRTARDIVQKIRRRDIYTLCGDIVVPHRVRK